MSTLSYVNVFAQDIVRLSTFYSNLFGSREIEAIRSPIFRGLDTGKSCIGFNALDAYELLGLGAFAVSTGCRFLLNIDVSDQAEVGRGGPTGAAGGGAGRNTGQGAVPDLLQLVSGRAAGPRAERLSH